MRVHVERWAQVVGKKGKVETLDVVFKVMEKIKVGVCDLTLKFWDFAR